MDECRNPCPKLEMEDILIPSLYYSGYETSLSIEWDTQELYALMPMPQNREVMVWMNENDDEIHVIDGLGDNKHATDNVRYANLFAYSSRAGYLKWNFSHENKYMDT